QFTQQDENIYTLSWPLASPRYLTRFIEQNISHENTDLYRIAREFIYSIEELTELQITFNQEFAFENKEVVFINAYSPLIIATKNFFEHKFKNEITAFGFSIDHNILIEHSNSLNPGNYFLAVYKLTIDKQSFNNKSTNEITMPILFDIEEDEIVREYEKVETFFGLCQEYATILHFPAEVDDEVINNLRVDLSEEIDKKNNEIFKEQEIKFNTSIALHKQQEEAYF